MLLHTPKYPHLGPFICFFIPHNYVTFTTSGDTLRNIFKEKITVCTRCGKSKEQKCDLCNLDEATTRVIWFNSTKFICDWCAKGLAYNRANPL